MAEALYHSVATREKKLFAQSPVMYSTVKFKGFKGSCFLFDLLLFSWICSCTVFALAFENDKTTMHGKHVQFLLG